MDTVNNLSSILALGAVFKLAPLIGPLLTVIRWVFKLISFLLSLLMEASNLW